MHDFRGVYTPNILDSSILVLFPHAISFQTKHTLLDIISPLPDGALFNLVVLMELVLLQHFTLCFSTFI